MSGHSDERRKAVGMLRQSEKKFSMVFNANPAAMTLSDAEGRWVDVNESFVKLTGYSKDELIGHTSEELNLIDTGKLKQYNNELQEKSSKRDLEFEILTKSGEKRIVLSSSETIELDGEIRFISFIYDVSERKKTELKLRILNDRLDIASRAAGVGIWDWNTKSGQLEWSPVMFDLFGLDPDKTEASFEVWENTLHAEDLEKASLNIELAINEHAYLDNEYRIVLPNGQIRWINALGQAEYDDQDHPQRMTGICIDITERKKIEEDLEMHAALLDVSNEAIFSWDYEGGILSWNQGAERLYEYSDKEAIGLSSHELLKTEFPLEFNEFIENLDNNKNWSGELIHKRKNGDEIIVESRMQLIQHTGKKIIIETNRDITKRKQVEIRLKETLDNLEEQIDERTKELLLANTYNRNLIETALDPLVTIGPDGKITDMNKATEKVTGYSREELVGTDFADYFTNPEEAKKGYQQVFKSGMVRDYPLEIRHENGGLTPVLYNASVYMDKNGEVVGVFAAARDITERKKAEEELKEYWENLEEQVKLRTEELAKSNADLKQFAYVASHDLREPLRMITSFLQLLERRYKDQLDSDAKEFIDFAVDGARRLDKMIMDLLEYSRVANKEMMFSKVNFEEVMDQIKLNLNVRIHENNANITYDHLPLNVRADENQMILLFQNLIGNAIKYRSDEEPEIQVSAEKENNQYVFSVKDNGIGIDPKHLKRIFTIFQRLHTPQEYEGSGIGLSIAQRIVHQHGGEIWAESEAGKGSTFKFTI